MWIAEPEHNASAVRDTEGPVYFPLGDEHRHPLVAAARITSQSDD